jgi:hypothetical protein
MLCSAAAIELKAKIRPYKSYFKNAPFYFQENVKIKNCSSRRGRGQELCKNGSGIKIPHD